MVLTKLNTVHDYANAVERLEAIMEGPMSPKEREEFNILYELVSEYETLHFNLSTDESGFSQSNP